MRLLHKIRAFLIRNWLRWIAPRWTVGSLVLLRHVDGRVCLLKHKGRVKPWGLPGGLVTWPETPERGLRRELAEELGWMTELTGPRALTLKLVSSCISEKFPMLELIYLAEEKVSEEVSRTWLLQPSEISELGWFSLRDLETMDGLLERHRSVLLSVLRSN